MERILLVSFPADSDAANAVHQHLLSDYPQTILTTDATSPDAVDTADALLLFAGHDWQQHIMEHAGQRQLIAAGLRHSDLPVMVVLIDGARRPSVTELPEDLRALAYMTGLTLSREHLARDAAYVANVVHSHLQREAQAPAARVGAYRLAVSTERRTPWNLILLIGILVLGVVLMILSAGRGGYSAGGLLPLAGPTATAPANAFTPTEDELLLALVAGVGDDPTGRAQTAVQGAELALRDRPEVMIDGTPVRLELIVIDSPCSARAGLQAAEIVSEMDALAGVIGHMCDTSCSAAAARYDAVGISSISPACTAPELAGITSSFFRSVPSAATVAAAAAVFIAERFENPRVAVLHDELPRYRYLAQAFVQDYEAQAGVVSGVYAIVTTALDINALTEQVLAENPQVIYYAGRASTAAEIAANLPDLPLVIAEADIVTALLDDDGVLTGEIYTVALLPPQTEPYSIAASRYAEIYGAAPEGTTWAYAYDAVRMLLDGLEATASLPEAGRPQVNRTALQAFLRDFEGEGITGRLNCAGTGDCGTAPAQIYVMRNGALAEETVILP